MARKSNRLNNHIFTEAQMNLLRSRFDCQVTINDTNEQIRWKAAQRDVVRQIEYLMEEQEQAEAFPSQSQNLKKGPQYKD